MPPGVCSGLGLAHDGYVPNRTAALMEQRCFGACALCTLRGLPPDTASAFLRPIGPGAPPVCLSFRFIPTTGAAAGYGSVRKCARVRGSPLAASVLWMRHRRSRVIQWVASTGGGGGGGGLDVQGGVAAVVVPTTPGLRDTPARKGRAPSRGQWRQGWRCELWVTVRRSAKPLHRHNDTEVSAEHSQGPAPRAEGEGGCNPHFSAFFLHFTGGSLRVMFKRNHFSGIVLWSATCEEQWVLLWALEAPEIFFLAGGKGKFFCLTPCVYTPNTQNFVANSPPPVVYIQNDQRVMGIILRDVCWGNPPPPHPGSPAVWVNGAAPDTARARRGGLAVWPDQAAATSAPSGCEPSP